MQQNKSTAQFVKVFYKNRVLCFSKKACIFALFLTFVIITFITIAIKSSAESARKIEHLQAQLLSERTVNESLTREIQKYSKSIEQIATTLSGEREHKKNIQYNNITSMLQVYGILSEIQHNLQKIDKTLDNKIQKVRNIINVSQLNGAPLIRKGFEKFNIAESIHANHSSDFIQKASKSTSILSGLDISDISERILLKKQGLDVILKSIAKIPFERPVKNGRFVSGFGHRLHPIYKHHKMHNGIDFVAPRGAKILATADGIIEKAVYSRSYGNFVVIRHANNIKTLYAHMSKIRVTAGQKVKVGHAIGVQGTTGTSTGEHIHYEIIVNNQHKDPTSFIRSKSIIEYI